MTTPVRRLDEATAARQPGAALATHDRSRDALPAVTGAGRRPAEPRSGRPRLALRADRAAPRPVAHALPAAASRSDRARSLVAGVVVVALVAAGCTASPTPIPSPSASPTPAPTIAADGVSTLRFAISGDPSGLLPPARDADTRRIQAFLYDSLYRLDDALRPVPVLAADVPKVSKDGKTWTIPIRSGLTFSDDSALDAGDVAATLRLARSLACPFADACRIAAEHLLDVQVKGDAVVLTLDRPWAPLLTTFLADLPILPSDGLQASLDRLVAGAKAVDRKALAASIGRISDEVNAEACDGDAPPATCEPAEHIDELAGWLAKAGVTAPLPERFADESGTVDGDAYGIALLAAVDALADVLGRPGAGATPRPSGGAVDASVDRMAKALPLLDLGRAPVGTGPYRLVSYVPGGSVVLERRGLAAAGAPRRVQAVILRDAVEAATALQSGQIDWLPTVAPEVVPILESDPHPGRRGAARRAPCAPSSSTSAMAIPTRIRAPARRSAAASTATRWWLTSWPSAVCRPRPWWRRGHGRRGHPGTARPTPPRHGPCSKPPATCSAATTSMPATASGSRARSSSGRAGRSWRP